MLCGMLFTIRIFKKIGAFELNVMLFLQYCTSKQVCDDVQGLQSFNVEMLHSFSKTILLLNGIVIRESCLNNYRLGLSCCVLLFTGH